MPSSSRYPRVFFALCFGLVLFLFFQMLRPFLISLILALTVVSLFYPNYQQLRSKLGQRSGLSAMIMCAIVTFLVIIPLLLVSLALVRELNVAYDSFLINRDQLAAILPGSGEGFAGELWRRLGRYLALEGMDLATLISALVDRTGAYLVSHSSSILGGVGALLLNFLVMLLSMFFFFREGDQFHREVRSLIPLSPTHKDRVFRKLREITEATFFGIFATGICQGLVAGLIFFALGIQNPLLWGAATAFFSVLPVVGTSAVWIPMAAYLILSGSLARGIVLLILGASVIGLVDNFVRPMIIKGRSEGMHLLLVFFALGGGIYYFGPAGLVLGPLVISLLLTFLEIYKEEFKEH